MIDQRPTVPTEPVDLRAERHRRGLSATQAAKEIGVSLDVILHAEKGGRPQPKNALKIAKYYGLDVLTQWPLERRAA